MMSDYPKITYRRHTFLSALALGVSAIAIALIVCCTVVIIYGMHFAGEKSEKLVSLVEDAVRGLPALQESLPPVFADILDDHRQPDYSSQLEITAKTTPSPEQSGRTRTSITVVNNGPEVVSLLSLRVVVLNAVGEIVCESNEWAATPFAADDDWPGPLMPGSRRYFSCSHSASRIMSMEEMATEVEVTDIRIWSGAKGSTVADTPEAAPVDTPDSPSDEPAENM
ncbi:MAG: hypothetical protein JSW66_00785 [Phycisphaerales bacterium]|nr:MAG: hypothetical protein JSW66_00785 [Phycisphaerales bacterium]